MRNLHVGMFLDHVGATPNGLGFQAVIKSAASAAPPEDQNPGIQGSLAVSVARQPSRRPLAPLDSWILVFGESELAANLITA